MSDLIELLQKWAYLEPDRCRAIGDTCDTFSIELRGARKEFIFDSPELGPQPGHAVARRDAYIQGAVQEAIRPRGWLANVIHGAGGTVFCKIQWAKGNEMPWITIGSALEDDAAEAWLSAYVEALESEAVL